MPEKMSLEERLEALEKRVTVLEEGNKNGGKKVPKAKKEESKDTDYPYVGYMIFPDGD